VDKLVKVWRKNGQPVWVLIHVEIQGQRDPTFTRRMYVYNCRLFDRYNCEVCSLAVLADDNPDWRPSAYRRGLWGCTVSMRFPPLKLLDYREREAELEASDNPFARVVLAHLKMLETRQDPEERRVWKLRIIRGLYESGFSREDVRQLFRLIDWLMALPEPLDVRFWEELEPYEGGKRMPYITSVERIGMRKMIAEGLRTKFGDEGPSLLPQLEGLMDYEKYNALIGAVITAETLDEARRAFTEVLQPRRPTKKKGRHGQRGNSSR
jgi:hypothetical protein